MANHSHNLTFGTTAHSSADGAVAPAVPARAEQSGHSEAAAALGAVAAEDADGCNCSMYQTCQFCTCPCGVQLDSDGNCPACETDRVCSNFDDAFMDSFYRTLGGLKGCE